MNWSTLLLLCTALLAGSGCESTRFPALPPPQHVRVLTYNVNWGGPRPDLAATIIANSKADIVCLQETNDDWAAQFQSRLREIYPHMLFRNSKGRAGGGLAFLSKTVPKEVAYIPSKTGWFDSWIMIFPSRIGPVQVLNVHLRPPVSDRGGWLSGYFITRDDRVREIQDAWKQLKPGMPTLIAGDFNDGEESQVIHWLEKQGMINALPQFDRSTPTWRWQTSLITLQRRMDHILYSPQLHCHSARVITSGASDHFPVEAVFSLPR